MCGFLAVIPRLGYEFGMKLEQRRKTILSLLVDEGRVRVRDLGQRFAVSDDTIRRDLEALSSEGFLQKTHGGAVSLDVPSMRRDVRGQITPDAKAKIGEEAVRHLSPGSTLMIDAGQTTLEVAKRLPPGPFTVITLSLDVAVALSARKDVRLIMLGGEWDGEQRLFRGAATVEAIRSYRATTSVMGACAVETAFGVTASEEWDCAAKRAMMQVSAKRMLVADHTKFGRREPFFVAGLEAFDTIVSDEESAPSSAASGPEPDGSEPGPNLDAA
ncbi:DeoR/GlpR family DNA-binding transcription regulator [Fulvimarina sp. MAC8]|uniref:DeoR/GlpR family DNA-binding transcription regulator n=1 Tax=Fulvimarina sp. MAC8 TaxID=3162874 RepID=UPI0032EB0035